MRSLIIVLALAFAVVVAVAADGVVEYLRARSTGSTVELEWQSGEEGNLKHFEVERASQDNIFRYVASVNAKGSNQSYRYTDDEAFGKGDEKVQNTYFTYRLKLVHQDNTVTYSTTAGVSHSVSTVKRTWGMIKEMFR